ncbi:desulforedoxin [SAR202 cluster bacterium AD-804-J14_MRT_500m]|nr:desulforedoxin [SAR202 cluster bacterium AD-804-J14_MRT_500m]
MPNQLGKRYSCTQCGTIVLCVKQGDGNVVCCDSEMEIQAPRPLPSSD